MVEQFNVIDLASKIVPIVIAIAGAILKSRGNDGMTEEEAAAIALFNALVAYLEVAM